MQGQRSAVGSMPELSFHHGSATSDSSIDPQRCWNNVRNPAQDQLSDCVMSSSDASIAYLNSARQEGHNLSGWSLGETSSSSAQGQVNQNDRMSVYTGAARVLGERQYGSSDILSLNNVDANLNREHAANGYLFMQTSSSASIPQDHNANSEFSRPNNGDDDCQVIGCVSSFRSGSSNEQLPGISSSSNPFGMPSGSGGYLLEESDGRPSSSLDGRRLSCKRKTIEGSAGQSSGSGSSNYLQDVEGSLWHAAAAHNIAASGVPASTGNNVTINLSEQVHPRLGLTVGGAAPEVPLTLSASGSAEGSRRNFRLRTDASHQQDCIPGTLSSTENVGGSYNVLSAQRSLRLQPDYNSLDLGSFSATENRSVQRPTVASLRRNPQSRWYRASSSGAGSSNSAISGERVAVPYDAPNSRSMPRDISEHPMFIPATNTGIPSRNPVNWSLAAGNVGTAGTIASSSRAGSSSGVNSPVPALAPHRNSPQYPRRLSEFVRRSLLPSPGTDSGSQNSSYNPSHSGPSSSSQEIALPSGSGNHGHRRLHTRSAVLLERHLGSALGIPYSTRTLPASSEGRSRLVSEIRNVLDLMRRGEGLRFEDVMILDQSVLFGMAELHDRHRDMRLDVDNMSYEELLALEERIGNVCTGLSEDTILSQLKHRKYVCIKTEEVEAEPCCICQEEYNDGEDLGILECGHDFHTDCIKQWLMHKNLCPICKTAGLTK